MRSCGVVAPVTGSSHRLLQVTPSSVRRSRCGSWSCMNRSTISVSAKSSSQKVGFRWDGANLRWVRDDRRIASNNATGGVMKPLTGGEYTVWPVVWTELKEKGVKTVSCEQAAQLVSKGWTLVDVRLKEQYDRQHAVGSISLPLYRYVQGDTAWDNVKRLAMAGFAMKATERNQSFAEEVRVKLKKNQKVIVLCDIGGTLETRIFSGRKSAKDPDRQFGRESRSLKGIYELLQVGWSAANVVHLEGGLPQWRYQGYPVEAS